LGSEASTRTEELSRSLEKLEFESVLRLVAEAAVSERTRERIMSSKPFGCVDEIEKSQALISEVLRSEEEGAPLSLSGWRDSRAAIDRIRTAGMVASCEDLSLIAGAEKTAGEMRAWLERAAGGFPLMHRFAGRLRPRPGIAGRIDKTIGPENEVLDRASPELARLRKQSSSLRGRLRSECARYASAHSRGRGEEFVTVRGDRYVISLPRDEAAHARGIVHHESGSGASLFIEPLEFVEENNRLEALLRREADEVARILAELTGSVFEARDELSANQDVLAELDGLASTASFARKHRCTRPSHSGDGRILLRGARHPILERNIAWREDGGSITGLDLEIDPGTRVLVISGPNAGGKTVALKTVGLMVLMDRWGLLLPCGNGTVIPDLDKVFADIGDDQSIEKSLSTFSSRVLRMKRIMECADDRSIVLVDEIGDGTDPEEGAALGAAMLEQLASGCPDTIVTTHLSFLKGWAHETEYAENATLEFDPETMTPLYRMRMGIPGRSWGLETAERMGLPGGVLAGAREKLGSSSLRLEELLSHLEEAGREAEESLRRLERREEELESLTRRYGEKLGALEDEREELQKRAREEALEIVRTTRSEMESVIKEIRTSGAARKAITDSKERIRTREKKLETKPGRKSPATPVDPGELSKGSRVGVSSLGREGRIIEIGDGERVRVELDGGLRVETTVGDLFRARTRQSGKKTGRVTISTSPDREPVTTELMIRGLEKAEAIERVDRFIDRAVVEGLDTVRIIHGIGRGVLKSAVYGMLRDDPRVVEIGPDRPASGGDGVAVVRLK